MFSAYKVAVVLSLQSNAAGILGLIGQGLRGTDADAKKLHASLGLVGMAMSATGIAGLAMFGKMLKPAEEYTTQLNKMAMAGMSQVDVAKAVGAAWKLAGQNLTTTATGNLKALLDLRNVTGSLPEAMQLLPAMQRMQTVLGASADGGIRSKSGDLAFSAIKALDVRGAVNDPANLVRQQDLMTRVIIGTQGRVTPEQFQSVFQYARQAKFGMSDDFAYKVLPTLMLEAAGKSGGGGGSRGVGPKMAALYRFTNQGFVNKKSLGLLRDLGLLTGPALNTGTSGTTTAPLWEAGLADSNSFEWSKRFHDEKMLPYMLRHHIKDTPANELQLVNQATRGNQLAGSLLGEYIVKRINFERDQKLLAGVMSPEEAYKNAMSKDPATARRALSAQWENFETSLMMNVAPLLVPALQGLSKGLNLVGDVLRGHPELSKNLVLASAGLAAAMAIGGTLLTTAAGFGALSKVLGGGGGGAGVISLIGKAGAAIGGVGIAGSFGWAIGSLIYELGQGTPAMDSFGRVIARVLAVFGNKDAQAALDAERVKPEGSWGSPPVLPGTRTRSLVDPVRPGGQQGRQAINNTIVMPNGQVLAKVVTEVQEREARLPTGGTTRFDGAMAPTPIGATGSW